MRRVEVRDGVRPPAAPSEGWGLGQQYGGTARWKAPPHPLPPPPPPPAWRLPTEPLALAGARQGAGLRVRRSTAAEIARAARAIPGLRRGRRDLHRHGCLGWQDMASSADVPDIRAVASPPPQPPPPSFATHAPATAQPQYGTAYAASPPSLRRELESPPRPLAGPARRVTRWPDNAPTTGLRSAPDTESLPRPRHDDCQRPAAPEQRGPPPPRPTRAVND